MLTDLFIIGIFKLLFVEQFVRRVFANCLAENMPFPNKMTDDGLEVLF